MEQVHECQSPLFLVVEVDASGRARPSRVHLFFSRPAGGADHARVRRRSSHEGLDGLTAAEVLAVPGRLPVRLGLAEAVSPLRLRGMAAMLGRIKRQVRARVA